MHGGHPLEHPFMRHNGVMNCADTEFWRTVAWSIQHRCSPTPAAALGRPRPPHIAVSTQCKTPPAPHKPHSPGNTEKAFGGKERAAARNTLNMATCARQARVAYNTDGGNQVPERRTRVFDESAL
jgi:hypothetical protein